MEQQKGLMRVERERGSVIVAVAVLLPLLCGCLGMVLDIGSLYYRNRLIQTAADAGAIAAAQELKRSNYFDITSTGREQSGENGFDTSNSTINVNRPPTSGTFVGDSNFVEVEIDNNASNFFMKALGFDSTQVSARAVAGLVPGGSGCIYVLDNSADKAVEVSSGSTIQADDCCVQVNSNSSNALSVTSGSSLTADCINVVGDYEDGGGTIDPEPSTGGDPASDPLADLAPPDDTGPCDYTDFTLSSQTATLSPGIYCGGLAVESGSDATLLEGNYILRGKGLKVSSDSSIEGTGISFYNTSGSGYDYEAISIESGSDARLSAPSTGDRQGVLFFQDRDVPSGYDNKIESGSTSWFEGALYFPTQHVMFHSNTPGVGGAAWTMIVAATLEVSSGTDLGLGWDFASSAVPSPIKRVSLVE